MFNQIQTLNNFFMKKIIYSLVAMLFMGGIITSCIEPVETDGIREIRYAHADYLRALAGLKDGDKAVKQAEAAYKQAQAAAEQGRAAQEAAKAEYYLLLNELQALQNEMAAAENEEAMDSLAALIEERAMEMEKKAIEHETEMCGLEAAFAEAQKNLSDALAALELYSSVISTEEQQAINMIKRNYDYYAGLMAQFYQGISNSLQQDYDNLYAAIVAGIPAEAAWEYILPAIEEELELAELQLQYAEQEAEFWKQFLNDFEFDYLAEANEFFAAAADLQSDLVSAIRDTIIYENNNKPAMEEAIDAAEEAYAEAKKAPKAAFDAAVKDIKSDINVVPDNRLDDTTATAPKASAKTFKYKFAKKGYLIPEHTPYDIVRTYEQYLRRWYNYSDRVEFSFAETEARDTLFVEITPEIAKKADYQKVVDSLWSGAQVSMGTLNMSTGLWSAYEDFSREYLYGFALTELQEDADAIAAYLDSVRNVYDSILNILKSAPANQADILLKAWYDATAAQGATLDELMETIEDAINYDDDPENDLYEYTIKTYDPARVVNKPIFLYNWTKGPKKFTKTAEKKFDVEADDTFLTGEPDHNLSMAPTKADSVVVLKGIYNFFKAIASIDEDAVPFLKYYTSVDGGATFTIQKVRADKVELAGFQLRNTDTYLLDGNLKKIATYDNKGIVEVDGVKTAAIENYYDAATNFVDLYLHYVYGTDLNEGLYDEEDDEYGLSEDMMELFDYVEWYTYGIDDPMWPGLGANLGKKTFDYYRGFDSEPFVKFSSMSEEGKALYNWLEACYIYFGVDGFGGFGEKVFFSYKTFTEPTMAVVYTGIPADGGYDKNEEGKVVDIDLDDFGEFINHYSSQYGFIINSIENNIEPYDGYYDAEDYAMQIDNKALVFKLFAGEYLYGLATGSQTADELWAKLGEVLQKVKADLDKVVTDTDAAAAKSAAHAAAYNEALATYRAAIKDALRERDAAIKAAEDEYEEGMKPLRKAVEEIEDEIDFNMGMYMDLMGLYGVPDPAGYINQKYLAAVERCANIAAAIASIEAMLEGISDPELDAILELKAAVDEVIAEMQLDQIAYIEAWYEYWKAAYEAAIAKYVNIEVEE